MKFFTFAAVLLLFWGCENEAQECHVIGIVCTFDSVTLSENQVLSNVSPNLGISEVRFESSNLHSVPGEIFGIFESMTRLELNSQKIQEIKQNTFMEAKILDYLNLEGNEIKILRENSFAGCEKLTVLIIRLNQIENIEEGAFNGVTNLKTLSLYDNKIPHINENLFEPLVDLETVDLRKNYLEFLSENVFKFNLELKSVDLEKNQLNSLSYKTFSKLTNLAALDLNHNECVDVGGRWISNAFESMNFIKEKLKDCEKNYNIDMKISGEFETIEAKFEKTVDEKIGSLEKSLDAIDAKYEEKFNTILQLFKSQEKNLESIVKSFDAKFSRMEKFEQKLNDIYFRT